MSDIDPSSLLPVCTNIGKGFMIRYGTALFTKVYDNLNSFSTALANACSRAGINRETLEALNIWLKQGVRAVSDFPPQIELIMHMARSIEGYPITDTQRVLTPAWYKLDTTYAMAYGKNWKGERPIDDILRERVWLSEFDQHKISEADIAAAMSSIYDSALFRIFPPTLEQFVDAVFASRKGAPLVELATTEFNTRSAVDLHPLVQQAKLQSGLMRAVLNKDRADFDRFRKFYIDLLRDKIQPVSLGLDEVGEETDECYESQESLLDKLKNW